MTLAEIIETLRGHGLALTCTLTSSDCRAMAESLERMRGLGRTEALAQRVQSLEGALLEATQQPDTGEA